jgi:hypothetical protein
MVLHPKICPDVVRVMHQPFIQFNSYSYLIMVPTWKVVRVVVINSSKKGEIHILAWEF